MALDQLAQGQLGLGPARADFSLSFNEFGGLPWASSKFKHHPRKHPQNASLWITKVTDQKAPLKPFGPVVLRCGPQTSSISITWEQVRHAHSQAPSHYCWSRSSGGSPALCILTSPPGDPEDPSLEHLSEPGLAHGFYDSWFWNPLPIVFLPRDDYALQRAVWVEHWGVERRGMENQWALRQEDCLPWPVGPDLEPRFH